MKIKLDENVPHSAVHLLGSAGHDVDTVADEGLTGAADLDVIAAAATNARLLLTLDRGLGDVRSYPPGTHAGIVVLRLAHQAPCGVTARSESGEADQALERANVVETTTEEWT